MQPITRTQFLHNVGYGAIALTIEGSLALAPLVNPLKLPPAAGALDRFASVDAQARALLDWYSLPGLAVGLVCGGRLAYARGYGVQDVRRRTPMSEYTVFAVGSLAKMLTGAAVMQLEERGKLHLDDPLVKHVPWFHMADPRYRHITIRSLLTHTAGLPEATFDSLTREFAQRWRDEGALERMARSLDGGLLLSQEPAMPDAEFRYSGIGYGLLGVLIQEISGEVFEDYMRRHILEPLQMVNSTFLLDEVKPQNLAAAHTRGPDGQPVVCEPFPYTRHFGPAAFLFTNVVDLSHFIMAGINEGTYHHRILWPDAMDRLWRSIYTGPSHWPGTGYNAGVFTSTYAQAGLEPVRMLLAMGGMPGVHTHVTIFPDQGLAAIVFVNLLASERDPNYSWGICDKLAIQLLNGEI